MSRGLEGEDRSTSFVEEGQNLNNNKSALLMSTRVAAGGRRKRGSVEATRLELGLGYSVEDWK